MQNTQKKYPFGIDASSYLGEHQGGKDQGVYNLLNGLTQMGLDNKLLIFCITDNAPKIQKLAPRSKVVSIKTNITKWYLPHINNKWGKEELIAIEKWGCKVLFLYNKIAPLSNFPIPTIVLPHDVQPFEKKETYWKTKVIDIFRKRAYKKILQKSDKVIAISSFDKKLMLKHFPDIEKRIEIIPQPVRFSNIPLSNNPKYITVLHYLFPHKNVKTVIKAFSKICDKYKYKLLLIGSYPNFIESIKELVDNLNIKDKVIFTGYVEDAQLNEYISQTKLYINASEWEGFGLTALEMMGNKVPTIVSNSTALPETTLGLCKYYSPANDHLQLAKTIEEVLIDPPTKSELDTISNIIKDKYSIKNNCEAYLKLFQSLIDKKN